MSDDFATDPAPVAVPLTWGKVVPPGCVMDEHGKVWGIVHRDVHCDDMGAYRWFLLPIEAS